MPTVRTPLITSTANPAVKAARRLATRKGRRDTGAFLVEGPQAIAAGVGALTEVFATQEAAAEHAELLARAADRGAQVRLVSDAVLACLADTVTPQGVVGVADQPQVGIDDLPPTARFLMVLDGVADPGNAGTVIRTADAAGADAVLLTAGSVDPFAPKAVRASAGSVFHLPVITGVAPAALTGLAEHYLLVGAAADGQTSHTALDLTGPVALLLGSEAHGLSSDARAACAVTARIPIRAVHRPGHAGAAESLNLAAAAAVLAYTVAAAHDRPR